MLRRGGATQPNRVESGAECLECGVVECGEIAVDSATVGPGLRIVPWPGAVQRGIAVAVCQLHVWVPHAVAV